MIKNGKIWPLIIAISIFGIVLLSYWTIKETAKADLTQSNLYMDNYHNVDDNINDLIEARIDFDRKYTLKFKFLDLKSDKGIIVYTLRDKNGKAVNDANVTLILSRPISDAEDITLKPLKIKNGEYIFDGISLPKKGRWDLILKVQTKDATRYLNLRADTRIKEVLEF